MPDYAFTFDGDIVVVRPKKPIPQAALPLPLVSLRIDPDTYDEARRFAPGWDIRVLEDEWRSWAIEKAIVVKDADAHFLSFCRKRGAYPGRRAASM